MSIVQFELTYFEDGASSKLKIITKLDMRHISMGFHLEYANALSIEM